MRKDYKMVNFDIYLPQYKALRMLAVELNCSMATIVRCVVDKFLAEKISNYEVTYTELEHYAEKSRRSTDKVNINE